MELPSATFGAIVNEGDKFFFSADSPIGIKEHIHVCIKRKDKILLLSTCSSQTDTAIRIARLKGYDINTFPMFTKNETNKFQKEITYINCNQVVEIGADEFGKMIQEGKIHRLSGCMDEESLKLIANGIRLSTEIERRIKDLFEE